MIFDSIVHSMSFNGGEHSQGSIEDRVADAILVANVGDNGGDDSLACVMPTIRQSECFASEKICSRHVRRSSRVVVNTVGHECI